MHWLRELLCFEENDEEFPVTITEWYYDCIEDPDIIYDNARIIKERPLEFLEFLKDGRKTKIIGYDEDQDVPIYETSLVDYEHYHITKYSLAVVLVGAYLIQAHDTKAWAILAAVQLGLMSIDDILGEIATHADGYEAFYGIVKWMIAHQIRVPIPFEEKDFYIGPTIPTDMPRTRRAIVDWFNDNLRPYGSIDYTSFNRWVNIILDGHAPALAALDRATASTIPEELLSLCHEYIVMEYKI